MSDPQSDSVTTSAGEAAPSSLSTARNGDDTAPAGPAAAASSVLAALRFYSRLPVPSFAFERAPHAVFDFSRGAWAVAIAGALLGGLAGAVLLGASAAGLPAGLAALLALVALTMATGAMHEDGLADSADGLGGGATRERRLDIMRDSRIGAFGALALIFSVAIRVVAIAALADRVGPWAAALALVAVGSLSRVAGLLPLSMLPAARSDGAAASAVAPATGALARASVVAGLITLVLLWAAGLGMLAVAVVLAIAYAATYAVSRFAEAKIGGYTGDIAGAAQQAAELAILIALVALSAGA